MKTCSNQPSGVKKLETHRYISVVIVNHKKLFIKISRMKAKKLDKIRKNLLFGLDNVKWRRSKVSNFGFFYDTTSK